MEQMLGIIFENENNAHEAKAALRELALKGRITVYGGALILKHADGTVSVRDFDDFGFGTAVGSLIALLGTPKGLLSGSRSFAVGAPFGIDDPENARVAREFVDDVSAALTKDKFAIVAEIDEDWPTPLETEMEAAGGVTFRCPLWPVRQEALDARIGAMEALLVQLQRQESAADRASQARLNMRIEALQSRIHTLQRQAKARRESLEARHKANTSNEVISEQQDRFN